MYNKNKATEVYRVIMVLALVLAALTGCASASSSGLAEAHFSGSGGKGMKLGILVPESKGLNENQHYLPIIVQGTLVSTISKYSAITVLDRASLDRVIAETLDPAYEENLDIIRLGHVAHVGYMMTGNIVRTSSGYALQLNVTETSPGGATIASYSGTCTVAELEDFSAIHRASRELLTQIGVQLNNAAINELDKPSPAPVINAQANLARGISAQRRGTAIEAMAYYYNAVAFDPKLAEANGRLSALTSGIASGNIGENVRNDIQKRNEWIKILTEAEDFFSKHLPFEIIYPNALTQGNIDYNGGTVELKSTISLRTSNSFNIFNDILSGLNSTGKMQEWGLAYWPTISVNGSAPGLFSRRIGYADYFPSRQDERNSAEKDVEVSIALINENGSVIANDHVMLRSYIRFALIGRGETSGDKFRSANASFMYYNNRFYGVDITKLEATEAQQEIRFVANVNDITDNLTIKIVSVNGIDITKNTDYIRVLTR